MGKHPGWCLLRPREPRACALLREEAMWGWMRFIRVDWKSKRKIEFRPFGKYFALEES